MIFKQIGPNRYRVQRDEKDTKHHGTIEKQEYTSINMETGKRTTRVFWIACGPAGGWREASKEKFDTREEAGHALLKESKSKYADRKMAWSRRQGESDRLKAAKGK